VIWSDESKFQIFGSDGRKYCWKYDGEPLKNTHVKPTVKYGGGSIMVWGCFAWDSIGDLVRINGRMDAELYRQILSEDLIRTIDYYGWDKSNIVFQHDNDKKHTSALVRRWLTENEVPVLDWPSQSPDLNPIEHLWSQVDRQLRALPTKISSEDVLWESIEEVWNDIDPEFLKKLVATMPERVNDVIRAKGGYTRW